MMTTRRAAIVAPMRTPVGTFGGSLRAADIVAAAPTGSTSLRGSFGMWFSQPPGPGPGRSRTRGR